MKLLSSCIAYLFPLALSAQGNPFAIWENPSTNIYWFVSLDAGTGVKTDINSITGVSAFVAGSATAFNTDSMHYIFRGLNGSVYRLYTIDALTGNTLHSPLLAGNVVGLHYNCNDHMFYGMRESGNLYDLVSVNPVTGTVNVIAPLSGISSYVSESFSFNPHTQQLNMVIHNGVAFYLRSYSVISGAMIYNNLFPDNVTAHRYSCADTTLYGLWENNNVYKFEKINTATGTHTTINTLVNVTPGYVSESASINMNGNYIYRGFDGGNNFSLISIDASTGAIINIVNTSDNAVGFEEGICCYDIPTSVNDYLYTENISVSPVPFTRQVNFSAGNKIFKAEVFSIKGEKIYEAILNERSKSYSLLLPDVDAGIYFLKITFSDDSIATKKLVRQ